MRKLISMVFVVMMIAGCAATTTNSVFLGEYSNNLQPGTGEGDPKFIWVKPGADFTKYNKVMVDYVVFAFADESEYKGIQADDMKELADAASLALVTSLQKAFPVVSQPGPDVLRIRVAITDLKMSSPVLSGVTSVVPVGLAISIVKKGTTDSWTGSGATTAEMMVLDSMTNEVLGAGIDKKEASFTERFTKWGAAHQAFEFWADRFTKRLAHLTQK